MKKLILVSFVILIAPALLHAQRIPVPGPSPLTSGGGVTGRVRLVDCNAGPANVRISVGTRSVQPRAVEGNDFEWSYSITGLTPGKYTVRAAMAIAFCRGGAWTPTERIVTVENTLTPVRNVDFEFRGRRITTRLNASLLASLIEGVFTGTVIHLNNFTRTSHAVSGRDSWLLRGDAFVTRSAAMGGGTTPITLEEVSRGPLRYYVRDLNLDRVTVRPETDAFRLTFRFETGGPVEITGRCSNTTASIDPACALGSDDSAPDFNITDARLEIILPPVRDASGSLTYGPARVNFELNVEGGGVGSISTFEDLVSRSIKRNVEPLITGMIDNAALRRTVARSLRPALDRAGVGNVINVRFEGSDLVIESYAR